MAEFNLPHNHGSSSGVDKIKKALSENESFEKAATLFKQIGDPSRLRIFWLLCHREECVIDIAALVDMTTPAVSHHLKKLSESGLVLSRRDGKEVYYRAANNPEATLLHTFIECAVSIVCPLD